MEPENRQLTIDEIVDTARATADAILAQLYPADPNRGQHPEEYAISPETSRRLLAAGRIMSDTLDRFPLEYVLDGTTPGGKLVLDQQRRDAIFAAFKKKRVAQRDTIRLARKVLQGEGGKWWTVLFYGAQPEGQPGAGLPCYTLVTDEGKKARITPDTYPSFYEITPDSADNYRAAQREALGLTPFYRYLTAREWETLSNIMAVFDGRADETQEIVSLVVASSPSINAISHIGRASLERSEGKNGVATFFTVDGVQCYIAASDLADLGEIFALLSPNAKKLLFIGNNEVWATNNTTGEVDISLRTFKYWTGITDDKTARETIKRAIGILTSFTTMAEVQDENGRKRTAAFGIMNRAGRTYYNNGKIHLSYEPQYFELVKHATAFMSLPIKIMRLSASGNDFKFADYIHEDHRRNVGKAGRDHIVSVEKLLAISTYPDPTDPHYTGSMRKGQEGQLIMTPFLDTFDRLEAEGILTGELWLSAKAAKPGHPRPLTIEEMDRALTDYSFFRTLTIHYSLYGEPDYTDIAKRRDAYRAQKAATKKRKRGRKPKKTPAQG